MHTIDDADKCAYNKGMTTTQHTKGDTMIEAHETNCFCHGCKDELIRANAEWCNGEPYCTGCVDGKEMIASGDGYSVWLTAIGQYRLIPNSAQDELYDSLQELQEAHPSLDLT